MNNNNSKNIFLKSFYRFFLLNLTESGRTIVFCTLIAMALGNSNSYADTFFLTVFLFCFGLISLVPAFFHLPYGIIRHNLPRRVVAGESIPFTVTFENLSRFNTKDMVVQAGDILAFYKLDPPEQIAQEIGSGEKISFRFQIQFFQRGSFLFPGFRADTLYPFGLMKLGRKRQAQSAFLVCPSYIPLQEFSIPTGRRYQPGGIPLASQIGDSAEYIGNKEYQEGDKLRDIDWRSWARTGVPIVREYQQEYFCRVALVLDTHLGEKKTPQKKADFEAALSLSASIADYLSRQEYLVDLFAAGPQIYIMEAGRSLAHFEQIMEVLACLEPCEENPFAIIEPIIADRISRLTTVIVVLLDLDEARQKFLDFLSREKIGKKVFICNSSMQSNSAKSSMQILSAQDIKRGIESL